MNKIFATNVVNINWKRVGVGARESWEAQTPFGKLEISKQYLSQGYKLKLPTVFDGQREISCDNPDEARTRANEELAGRMNSILDV